MKYPIPRFSYALALVMVVGLYCADVVRAQQPANPSAPAPATQGTEATQAAASTEATQATQVTHATEAAENDTPILLPPPPQPETQRRLRWQDLEGQHNTSVSTISPEQPLTDWLLIGPWGGADLRDVTRRLQQQPIPTTESAIQPNGDRHIIRRMNSFFLSQPYPTARGEVDLTAVYHDERTIDMQGLSHPLSWQPASADDGWVRCHMPFGLYEMVGWIYAEQPTKVWLRVERPVDMRGDVAATLEGQPLQWSAALQFRQPRNDPATRTVMTVMTLMDLESGWNRVHLRAWFAEPNGRLRTWLLPHQPAAASTAARSPQEDLRLLGVVPIWQWSALPPAEEELEETVETREALADREALNAIEADATMVMQNSHDGADSVNAQVAQESLDDLLDVAESRQMTSLERTIHEILKISALDDEPVQNSSTHQNSSAESSESHATDAQASWRDLEEALR